MRDLLRKGRKFLRLLAMPGPRAAVLAYGVAATTEHDYVLEAQPLRTVIDVGANRGQFSLAARHYCPQARIIAFEPLVTAAVVYRAIFAEDGAVRLHEAAISPVAGKATMQISKREDSSSLLPISTMQTELFPTVIAVGTTQVPAGPLSDFVAGDEIVPPALLKIDVQGFELEVLKASIVLLPRFGRIYVEASFIPLYVGQALAHAVIDFLHVQGFVLTGMFNPTYHPTTGALVQADLLFENVKS